MEKNFYRLFKTLFVLLALLPTAQTANALGQKELQQLLDSYQMGTTRAGDNFKEIDLSAFNEPFTETLYVRNQNVRFVNGTIRRAESLEGPLIKIINGYTLELSSSATLSGNNMRLGYPIVEVEDGKLSIVDGSSIIEPFNPSAPEVLTTTTVSPDETLNSDRPVRLTSDNSHFVMKGGTVQGEITCDADNADIQILAGVVKWVEGYQVTTRSDIHLNPNTCSRVYTGKNKRIYLRSAITDTLRVGYRDYLSVGDCILEGEGYSLTQSDVDKLSLYYEPTLKSRIVRPINILR